MKSAHYLRVSSMKRTARRTVPQSDASQSALKTAGKRHLYRKRTASPSASKTADDKYSFDEVGLQAIDGNGISESRSHTAVFARRTGHGVIIGMDSLTMTRQLDGTFHADNLKFDKSIILYDTVIMGGCGDSVGAFELSKPVILKRMHEMLPRIHRKMETIAISVCKIMIEYCRKMGNKPASNLVSFLLVGIAGKKDDGHIYTIESDGEYYDYQCHDVDNLAGGPEAMRWLLILERSHMTQIIALTLILMSHMRLTTYLGPSNMLLEKQITVVGKSKSFPLRKMDTPRIFGSSRLVVIGVKFTERRCWQLKSKFQRKKTCFVKS